MNEKPQYVIGDLQCCIELLVDGELDHRQRAELVARLDAHPGAWRDCALAFMDEQFLTAQLSEMGAAQATPLGRSTSKLAPVKHPREIKHPRGSNRINRAVVVAATCAAVIMGFLLGHFSSQFRDPLANRQLNNRTLLDSQVQSPIKNAGQVRHTMPNALVEIENTDEQAIYYVDHEIPKFLLQAIVFAGHEVSVGQTITQVVGPMGEMIDVPINTLRIRKYTNPNL